MGVLGHDGCHNPGRLSSIAAARRAGVATAGNDAPFPIVGWSRPEGGPFAVSLPGEQAVGSISFRRESSPARFSLHQRQQLVLVSMAVVCALAPASARASSAER